MRRIALTFLALSVVVCLGISAVGQDYTYYAMDDSTNTLYTVNPSTYALTEVGYTGQGTGDFGDMAYDPNTGTAYWVPGRGNDSLFALNLTTGSASLIGMHGVDDMFALAYDPTTNLLYGESSNSNFYSINPSTGAATLIANNSIYPGGLTYNSTTGQLILTMAGGTGNFYSINPANGQATLLGSPGYLNDNGVTWDPVLGRYIVDDWNGHLYVVNPNNWTYSIVSNLNGDPFDGIIDVGASSTTTTTGTTPEPASLLLLGTGLFAVIGKLRWKR